MEENSSSDADTTNTNQPLQGVQLPPTPSGVQSSIPQAQTTQPSVQQPQVNPQNQFNVQGNQQNVQVVSTAGGEDFQEKPGGIRLRFSAYFFDSLITSAPLGIIWGLKVMITENYYGFSGITTNLMLVLIYLLVITGYFVYFDLHGGSTPGKKIYGLKVIDIKSKQNLNFKNAAIREFIARVVGYIPLLGIIFSVINFFVLLSSAEKRGIHDKLSNSQVLVVKKSWSIIKQLGILALLIAITIAPYIIIAPKYFKQSEEVNNCIIECLNSKNLEGLGTLELQQETQRCNQQCVK